MIDRPSDRETGIPRWAWVSGVIVLVLVLLGGVMALAGGGLGSHGPWRHMSGGDTPPGDTGQGGQQP
jgi:hypothetical protein